MLEKPDLPGLERETQELVFYVFDADLIVAASDFEVADIGFVLLWGLDDDCGVVLPVSVDLGLDPLDAVNWSVCGWKQERDVGGGVVSFCPLDGA